MSAYIRARRWLTPAIAALTMAICLFAANWPALACGGGGSGSYRKPPRPGHQHQSAASNPQSEIPAPSRTKGAGRYSSWL
jgi:hypothetical protein